jgi:hypothetical protein
MLDIEDRIKEVDIMLLYQLDGNSSISQNLLRLKRYGMVLLYFYLIRIQKKLVLQVVSFETI